MTRFEHLGIDLSILAGSAAHDGEVLDLRAVQIPAQRARVRQLDPRTWASYPPGFFEWLRDDPQPRDLEVKSERENLAQALILRLLTPRGSLRELGHGEYGSRLNELIGRLKTDTTRNLCRAFVLEAVAQEPRVESRAVFFEFDLEAESLDSVAFLLGVQPIGGGDPIELALEVAL